MNHITTQFELRAPGLFFERGADGEETMAEMKVNSTSRTMNGAGVVYLVEEQANPSTDFSCRLLLLASGRSVVRCGFDDLPASTDLEGATVVFVRYVPRAWVRLVEEVRSRLDAVVFLWMTTCWMWAPPPGCRGVTA